MKPPTILTIITSTILLASAATFTACSSSESMHSGMVAKQYTCTMHPEVVQDKPGKCPKCDMDLTEKR